MDFCQLIDERRKKLLKNNINSVMKDASKTPIPDYLKNKIENECKRKGYNYDDILNKIKVDEMYASFFAKDPLKQNLAEKLQLEILSKTNKIEKLSSNGENAKYLSNGELLTNLSNKPIINSTKSLDFYDSSTNTYYYCKYINEDGGAQDNQYDDSKKFILNVNLYYKNNINSNIKFILLIDGNYFNQNRKKELNNLVEEKIKLRIMSSFSV